MPCAALARGIRATVSLPGFATPSAQPMPFLDAINNSPCARKLVTSVGGVNTTAANLCIFHWMMANGQQAAVAPIVQEP
jgi:hypothetical protein